MFGVTDDELIANLERMRSRACVYGSDLDGPRERCDCKYGGSGTGEQTGCPELRQAIKILQGKRDEVHVSSLMREQTARDTLAQVMLTIDRYWKAS